MATTRRKKQSRGAKAAENGGGGSTFDAIGDGFTGRYLVLLDETDQKAGVEALRQATGLRARSFDADARISGDVVGEEDAIVLPNIGVAVISGSMEQMQRASVAASGVRGGILAIEPERIVHALNDMAVPFPNLDAPAIGAPGPLPPPPGGRTALDTMPFGTEYLRGYRAAVNDLVDGLLARDRRDVRAESVVEAQAAGATWGLVATNVTGSQFSGNGVRVAVLDTGFDLQHPDFQGRQITTASFVSGQSVQDGNGHGTHCIGTALGPRMPGVLPRYGVAFGAVIFAGKVLSNQGSGGDAGILAGIDWALQNRCDIVSMSLGGTAMVGQPHSQVYEAAASRALQRGMLIIAAAGNESTRPTDIRPVGHPANCPSILAVAAIDQNMQIASFSCGGLNGNGGEVNIAGPGVGVYSSWPLPRRYNTISGTSMATPHVAGIAALIAEASGLRGLPLALRLLRSARRLQLPARDVGWGLVQAP